MARTRAKWRHTPPIESTKRASKTGRDGDEDDYSDSVSIPGSIDDEQPSNEGHEHHTANKGHSDVDDGLDLDLIKNLRVINKVGHKTVKVYDPPCDYCSERSRDCLWDALSKKCAPCVRAHIACKRSGVSVVELLKKAQAVHFSVTSESLTAQSLSMKTNNAKSIASTDSPPPERRSKRPSRPTNGDEYLYFHPASKGKSVVAGRQNSASGRCAHVISVVSLLKDVFSECCSPTPFQRRTFRFQQQRVDLESSQNSRSFSVDQEKKRASRRRGRQ
jgi:hypothetical protein